MTIKTDQQEIQAFLTDASNYKGFCEAVYFPANSAETAEAVLQASNKGQKITVAGSGTGLTGARVPEGGIVIATEKMNRICEINKEDLYAIVEPGVILSSLQAAVDEKQLLYPPDPTETSCFIGGTVATNASGARTFRYGPTRDYIEALEIVLPNSHIARLERGSVLAKDYKLEFADTEGEKYIINLPDYKMPAVKNASGFYVKPGMDAIDLFIGSEGSLGIITKIKLKLLAKPEKIISCVVFFNDEEDALKFIDESRNISVENRNAPGKQEARALEYFDENSLLFLGEDFPQIPANSKAAVWFEQEATLANEDEMLELWLNVISRCNGNEETVWFASNEKEQKDIHAFRHAISAKVNEYIARNNYRKLGTDVAVPDAVFGEFYYYCKKIVGESGIRFVAYGHFGNSHIHLNMLPESAEQFTAGKELYHSICKKAIELKGTISAEHGVGKIKTGYLVDMYGKENIKQMAELKRVFDPKFLLGAGNIIPQSIIDEV